MPDYDLGTAHGKVKIDYDGRGVNEAERDLGRLDKKTGEYGSSASKSADSTEQLNKSLRDTSKRATDARGKLRGLILGLAGVGKSADGVADVADGIRETGVSARRSQGQVERLASALRSLRGAGSGARTASGIGYETQEMAGSIKSLDESMGKLANSSTAISGISDSLKGVRRGAASSTGAVGALNFAVRGLHDARRAPQTVADSIDRIASASLAAAGQVAALTATTDAMNAMRNQVDLVARSVGNKENGLTARVTGLARAMEYLSRVATYTVGSTLLDLTGLSHVLTGVPAEMAEWPKALKHAVALASAFSLLENSFSIGKGFMNFFLPGPGILGALARSMKGVERGSFRLRDSFAVRLPMAFAVSNAALNTIVKGFAGTTKTIANFSLAGVFALRTMKSSIKAYKAMAWATERASWSMGAYGIASIGVLRSMTALTGLVRGTGNAMKQLSGSLILVPAAMFAIGASLATAIVGFKGFGSALGAIGKDQSEFDEATKGLADSAKALAVSIRGVRKDWGEFQKGVQEKTFDGLSDRFESLSEKYLPALERGMGASAKGLNHIIHRFSEFGEQETTVKSITKGFEDTGTILRRTGDSLTPLLVGLREIGRTGLSALTDYSAAWESYAIKFAKWAQESVDSGNMRRWVDDSIDGFKDLGVSIGNIGKAINNTFKPFYGGDISNALEKTARGTEKFAEFMSTRGAGGAAVQSFVDHLGRMAAPWLERLPDMLPKIQSAFEGLSTIMETFSDIASQEAALFVKILAPAFDAVVSAIERFAPAIKLIVTGVAAFRALKWIGQALQFFLSPLIHGIATMLAFRRGMDGVKSGITGLAGGLNAVSKASTGPMKLLADGMLNVHNSTMKAVDSVRHQLIPGAKEMDKLRDATSQWNRQLALVQPQVAGIHTNLSKVKGEFAGATEPVKAMTVPLGKVDELVSHIGDRAKSVAAGFRPVKLAAADMDALKESTGRWTRQVHLVEPQTKALYNGLNNIKDGSIGATSAVNRMPPTLMRVNAATTAVANGTRRLGGMMGTALSKSFQGAGSAVRGLSAALGGPLMTSLVAAGTVVYGFVENLRTSKRVTEEHAKSSQKLVKAQRDLQMIAGMGGDRKGAEATAEGMKMVEAELEKVASTAQQASGILQGPVTWANNLANVSYEELAEGARNAVGSMDRAGYEGQMAAKKQQALQDALKATKLTQEEANQAFVTGGPVLDRLKQALTDTGGAGVALIQDMSRVGASMEDVFSRVDNMGSGAAALSAAMKVISDSAASAEDKLGALKIALQSLGLMATDPVEALSRVREGLDSLVASAAGIDTSTDAMGESFLLAEGGLNVFNDAARGVYKQLYDVREAMLGMDAETATKTFAQAAPQLEQFRASARLTKEEWTGVLQQMGLTPESIETQISLMGMDATEQALFLADKMIGDLNGKKITIEMDNLTPDAVAILEEMGIAVANFDAAEGTATVSVADEEGRQKLTDFVAEITGVDQVTGTGQLNVKDNGVKRTVTDSKNAIMSMTDVIGEGVIDANKAPADGKVAEAKSNISSLDFVTGMGTLDADPSGANSKTDAAHGKVSSLNAAYGLGILDADYSRVQSAVSAAQGLIDGLRGRTIYVDVVMNAPLPAAGPLPALPGQTGGRYSGNAFNLKGYRSGGRHKGYRLPSNGPGTHIVDGFTALNRFGAPIARLDKDEWVVNGKSSKKHNRLIAAINRDDPRLKYLPKFAEGGVAGNVNARVGQVQSAVNVVTSQLNLEVNAGQVEAAAKMMADLSSDAFAAKFGKGIADGLNLGSRDYFIEQGRQYSDRLGIVFGKAAQDANDRLQAEIDAIEDNNLKEQRRKTLKSTEELQAIADREMQEWVNNNQFEIMGYTMAQSFAQGVSSGQNLLQAGIGALGQAATVALAAAGAPGIVAGLAVTALTGFFDAFSDPDLWADGLFEGIYKIIDKMLAGLVTMVLDVLRNLFLLIGLDLAKVPIIGALYDIKDAANGTSKAVNDLMSDLEALNKLEYKNLGKTGATTIDDAIASQLGNRVLVGAGAPAAVSGPSGPSIGTLNVNAPDDKAANIIEAATFEMKRY